MKRMIQIAAAVMLFILGTTVQSHAQNYIQSLSVSLTAYDTVGNRTFSIGTQELIQYFLGTNIPNGHLYLVTPVGNAPGTIGDLNAFLRITEGTTTILEITSPNEFNLFQDAAASRTNKTTITIYAINRFSIDSGAIRAELQGISNWSIPRGLVNGENLSGTGSFQSNVNGWITIYNVTQPIIPIVGAIVASKPTLGF